MTSAKNGVSAKTLHRLLGFGSYQTAWTMLHRFRTAMVRPGRDRLAGDVEVDETFIGGIRPGKRGRGAEGKALVAVAIESLNPKGFGRCRLRTIPNAQAPTLRSFLLDCVEPGSVIVTDGFDIDEFAFRFNRRRSEFRGLLFRRLLEQAVEVARSLTSP